MVGHILDIKKFAIHDGPGIRTTVFLKGCPLRCVWCHNPEGLDEKNRLWYFENKCIGCKKCVSACANNALTYQESSPHIIINYDKCTNRGTCVDVCPTASLCYDGSSISSKEVVEILVEDQLFYKKSGGGITLSGGDPLYQAEFSLEILKSCKEKGIHTAIETCIYSMQGVFERFIDYVDLFIVDIKIFDPLKHKKYTGVDNRIIKDNFELIASRTDNILVRIPLIPGITTDEKNIRDIAQFVKRTNCHIPIELMNFNPLAKNKYRLMGKEYNAIKGMKPLSISQLDVLYKVISDEGLQIVRETGIKQQTISN